MRFRGAVVGLIVLVAPGAGVAQHVTSWGDPDLQGVWTNQTPVSLERPETLLNKTFFTEEEAVEFERTALKRLIERFGPTAPLSGELSEIWLDTQDGRVGGSRRTSLISDPPAGRIPFTPEGRERWDSTPRPGNTKSANGPEDRALPERCISGGGVLLPNPFASNYHHILQTLDHVAILSEDMHIVRIMPLDQRPHVAGSIGLWEGIREGDGKGRHSWSKPPTSTTRSDSEGRL